MSYRLLLRFQNSHFSLKRSWSHVKKTLCWHDFFEILWSPSVTLRESELLVSQESNCSADRFLCRQTHTWQLRWLSMPECDRLFGGCSISGQSRRWALSARDRSNIFAHAKTQNLQINAYKSDRVNRFANFGRIAIGLRKIEQKGSRLLKKIRIVYIHITHSYP